MRTNRYLAGHIAILYRGSGGEETGAGVCGGGERQAQSAAPTRRAAIAEARRVGATLLIAKLDRLSRNAGFIFALRDSGVDFVCCDMPDANTLTAGLFAVIAQHERETISKRTKDALPAKKARGFQLGTPANLTSEAVAKSKHVRQANARTHQGNRQAARLAALLQGQGHTLQQIARELNESGYRTRRGGAASCNRSAATQMPRSARMGDGVAVVQQ